MPAFNLIRDAWIPVVTRGGVRRVIRPADLTAGLSEDPIIDIVWPRADFRVAQLEFLIGLFSTACPPEDRSAWRRWSASPPSPQILTELLTPYEIAFDLEGDGPIFLQDRGPLGNETVPVSGLLIDQPGENTEKKNADLFVKRDGIGVLSRAAAAIAIYALQSFAPTGGAGNRTGLRGGGPLTTLARPIAEASLWEFVWLNVILLGDPLEHGDPLERPAKTFPWLGPTRTSDTDGVATTGIDIHPMQVFWGMPRRISLVFEPNSASVACDVTGTVEPIIVRAYRTRPHGVNYQAVIHPLTPTYRVKPGTERLSVHPQPGGIAYRHWLSFVRSSELRAPAGCVAEARNRVNGRARLFLSGYDMDNMKARSFVETEMPLLIASDAAETSHPRQDMLEILAERLVAGAVEVIGLTVSQIKAAHGGDGASDLDLIRETFFTATEGAFFAALDQGLEAIEAMPSDADDPGFLLGLAGAWLEKTLRPEGLATFDRHVPIVAIVALADLKAIERMVKARSILKTALAGSGPSGKRLFAALGKAAPVSQAKTNKTKARSLDMTQGNMTQENMTQENMTQENMTQENMTQENMTQENMTREKKEPPSRADIAVRWWRDLQDLTTAGLPNPRVDRAARARLRRATAETALADEAVLDLYRRLWGSRYDFEHLKLTVRLARVLVHLRGDTRFSAERGWVSFGQQIGRTAFDKPESTVLKPLRFKRLLEAEDDEDIVREFRRAADIAGNEVNIRDLCEVLLGWTDAQDKGRIHTRLAFDYFGARSAASDFNADNS